MVGVSLDDSRMMRLSLRLLCAVADVTNAACNAFVSLLTLQSVDRSPARDTGERGLWDHGNWQSHLS